eukprot:1716442-Rhodomonas_salina.1
MISGKGTSTPERPLGVHLPRWKRCSSPGTAMHEALHEIYDAACPRVQGGRTGPAASRGLPGHHPATAGCDVCAARRADCEDELPAAHSLHRGVHQQRRAAHVRLGAHLPRGADGGAEAQDVERGPPRCPCVLCADRRTASTDVGRMVRAGGNSKLWIPKCLCLLSHWPFHEPFREFLKQLYRISLTASRIPVERIIANLLYEVPLPPRGRVKVQYSIADKTIELFRTPANELPVPRVPLDVLFLLLDRTNALQVLTCVLLEQKMLFYSDSVSLLTTVAESILTLIFPFRWEHVYIPVLPLQLLEFVHAPTPFIMGVHPGSLKNRTTFLGSSCPDDVVVVNLDHNTVRLPARKLPTLPPKQKKKLLEHLDAHLPPVHSGRARRRLANIDLAFPMAPTPEESPSPDHPQHEALSPAIAWQVQYAFFRFLLSVLQRYRDFL